MLLSRVTNFRNFGLLILRVGIGIMFIYHGWPKISGGPAKWEMLGKVMGIFGIYFAPAFWGFMAAFSEFFGGILLAIGLFTREMAVLMTITMIVAAGMHLNKGDGLFGSAHAIELAILFFSFIFIGAGKYSLDETIRPLKNKWE